MPNKSFEEQVREELSGLRIKPNDAIWESVAASLQQKRKRRWAIWFLTLLVGLSGASFWFFIEQQPLTSASVKSKITSDTQKKSSIADDLEIKASIKNSPKSSDNEILSQINIPDRRVRLASPVSNTFLQPAAKAKKINVQKELPQSVVPVSDTLSSSMIVDANSVATATQVSTPQKDSQFVIPSIVGISEKAVIDSVQNKTVLSVSRDTVSPSYKQKKISKWKWRLAVQGGQSGVRNSWGSLFRANSADAYTGFFTSSNLPSSPSTGAGSFASSRIKSNDHLSLGVSIEMIRTFGKKKKNSVGLQLGYDLYQTLTRIGNSNTGTLQFSNVNRANESSVYYGVNDSANYIASYHFIRLGVQYYRSLKWIPKTDLRWYAGIGFNTMISGNGLHLGTANNNLYYFKNRSLLRTAQLDITTGIEFALGKHKRLFVAPQAMYMLSNISKQAGVNQHLFRPTIKVAWQLSKNFP